MTTESNNTQLTELDRLEKIIARGLTTYAIRNQLIVDLVTSGIKQAEVARRINKVRVKMGAPEVTPDAVAATLKRVQRQTDNPQNN